MSTVLIVTPLVIAAWPTIATAVTAVVATMGFAVASGKTKVKVHGTTKTEIEVENSEVLDAAGEEMIVERQGVRVTFSRDARGRSRSASKAKDTPSPNSNKSARRWWSA